MWIYGLAAFVIVVLVMVHATGRINGYWKGFHDFEPFMDKNSKLLETFQCEITSIDNGVASFLMRSLKNSDVLSGEYSVKKIQESTGEPVEVETYFIVETRECGDWTKIFIKTFVPKKLSDEVLREINALRDFYTNDDY